MRSERVFIAFAPSKVESSRLRLRLTTIPHTTKVLLPPLTYEGQERIGMEAARILREASSLPAFGFQLRNDNNRSARAGMLDLLRDALDHNWTALIDYNIDAGKTNGSIIRRC